MRGGCTSTKGDNDRDLTPGCQAASARFSHLGPGRPLEAVPSPLRGGRCTAPTRLQGQGAALGQEAQTHAGWDGSSAEVRRRASLADAGEGPTLQLGEGLEEGPPRRLRPWESGTPDRKSVV